MVIPGKGLTTSMDLSTKNSNKKKKVRFDITDITNQYFRKLLKKVKNSPYPSYKIKQVDNEPTMAYFSLITHITKPTKRERRVQPNFVIWGINETI